MNSLKLPAVAAAPISPVPPNNNMVRPSTVVPCSSEITWLSSKPSSSQDLKYFCLRIYMFVSQKDHGPLPPVSIRAGTQVHYERLQMVLTLQFGGHPVVDVAAPSHVCGGSAGLNFHGPPIPLYPGTIQAIKCCGHHCRYTSSICHAPQPFWPPPCCSISNTPPFPDLLQPQQVLPQQTSARGHRGCGQRRNKQCGTSLSTSTSSWNLPHKRGLFRAGEICRFNRLTNKLYIDH